MKCTLLAVVIPIVTNAYVINYKAFPSIITSVSDYHRTTGIPLAEKIKRYEENITSKQRITGGLPTEIDAVPYQAGLIISVYDTNSVCGGAVISDARILTAAHCYSAGTITVVLGSSLLYSGGTRIQTTDIVLHSGFNPRTIENDIAIITVSSITFSSHIQPVALPSGSEVNMDFSGYQAVASGYGLTSDDIDITALQSVRAVTVPVITNEECMADYGPFIHSQHLCTSGAGARGTCGGDSGGPLVVEINSTNVLIGLTSFGAELCTASYPSAYVRITEFLDWIGEQS